MFNRHHLIAVVALGLALGAALVAAPSFAQDKSIVVASTTSTQDSGLYEYLLPLFTKKTGITVKVVAQGTGKALDTGARCDADVVFVHAKAQEEKFLAGGHGVKRFPVMYNDFVIVGPSSDPAGIKGKTDVAEALKTIRAKNASFYSRGDRSGTHSAELALWKAVGIDIEKDEGPWYKSLGQGMGATLNTAAAGNGYTLTDRATWIHFKNKQNLVIEVEGDKRLFNQYGVMLVNPAQCPHVKKEFGQAFIDYLISPQGQKDIADYKVDGQQLFFPDADDPNA
jgi:tungstate transport system substrate-binding protein